MKNHCWKNNFQNKNFNFLAKFVLDKIVLDYLLACARWFHYLVGCTETTLRDCTAVQSQLKMNAEEIKAYQRARAPVLSSMWGSGVHFHRSFFTCTHPQVTGRCVHKLLGQAQVASAIIASRVSWSFSLGNYSFSTDSAILLRAEERFSNYHKLQWWDITTTEKTKSKCQSLSLLAKALGVHSGAVSAHPLSRG